MVKKLLFKVTVSWALILTSIATFAQCPNTLSISSSEGQNICAGTSVTFTADAQGVQNLQYQWKINGNNSGGPTASNTFTSSNLSNGDKISLTVTSTVDSCTKTSDNTLTMTVNPLKTPTVSVSVSKQTACPGEEITFTATNTNGGPNPSYAWYIGSGSSAAQTGTSNIFKITNLTNGQQVRVVLSSSANCLTSPTAETTSAAITINPAAPNLPNEISGTSTGICPGQELTYSLSGAERAETFIWTLPTGWTGSSTTNSITVTAGTSGGAIKVQAQNTCGSSNVKTMDVEVAPGAPGKPAPIEGFASVCPGTEVTYKIPAVPDAETYTWTIPDTWSGANSSTNTITLTAGSAGGNISVTAQNSCGESTATTFAVTVKPGIPVAPGAISGVSAVCPGSAQTYSIDPVPNASDYVWILPAGWSGTSTSTSIQVTAGSTGGQISVQARNECGTGEKSTLQTTIKAGTPEAPSAISGSNAVCPSVPETYSVEAVTGATQYVWTFPAGYAPASTTTAEPQVTVTTAASGSGTISVKAVNDCGESTSTSLAVTVSPPAPVMSGSIQGPASVCNGGTGLQYTIGPIQNADNYTWTVPSGWTITGGTGTNSIKVTAGPSGTISVIAENECGPSSSTSIAVTTTSGKPGAPGTISSTLPSTAICPPYNTTFSISGIPGATSYNWILPAGWEIASGAGTTSISVNITNNAAFTPSQSISVEGVNVCGAGPRSTLSGIAIDEYVVADLGADTTVCSATQKLNLSGWVAFGQNASKLKITSLTSTGTGSLVNPNNGKVDSFTYSYTPSAADLAAGQVKISLVTEKPGGACDAGRDDMIIFFRALPTAEITAVSPVCIGSTTTLNFSGTPNSRVTYSWGGSTQATVDLNASGTASVESVPINSNTTFSLTKAVNLDTPACTNSLSKTLVVQATAPPTAQISYAGTPFCSTLTDPQQVTLTGTGAYTGGSFSAPEGLLIDPGTGAITPSGSTAGTYVVSYTTTPSGGCSAVTSTTQITITPRPSASIAYEATSFCSEDKAIKNVQLTGENGYLGGQFAATPAGLDLDATTGAIDPLSSEPGSYTVTYTSLAEGGCEPVTATTAVAITQNPSVDLSYSQTAFCKSDNSEKMPILSGTANEGGSFSSDEGLAINADGVITPGLSTPGVYTVTYSIPASGGCGVVTGSAEVTITTVPQAEITYAGPFCTSQTTPAEVSFSNTAGNYQGGSFSSDQPGISLDPVTGAISPDSSEPGEYVITYTTPENGGCAPLGFTTSVVITGNPAPTIMYPATLCSSDTATYSVDFGATPAELQTGTFSGSSGLAIDNQGVITPSGSTPGDHTITYTLGASGGCEEISVTTSILIYDKPVITTQPENLGICSTNSASFTVVAQGDDLSYEWKRTDGTAIVQATGITSPTLSFANATSENAGEYYVVVTGAAGCASVESDRVTLNVDENIIIVEPAAPETFCDEEIQEIQFNFVAHANGAPLTFSWIKDGNTLAEVSGKIEMTVSAPVDGEYTGTLTIYNVTLSDNGVYAVKVKGPDYFTCPEATSKTFSLSVSPLPEAPVVQDIAYCQGDIAAPLTAEGTNLTWYSSETGTEALSGPPTPGTAAENVGETVYWVTQKPDFCESPRAALTVTVNPTPVAPTVANTALSYCYGAVADPLEATATAGNSLLWYGPNDSSVLLTSGAPVPDTEITGLTTYWVSQTTGTCESELVEVSIEVNPLPVVAVTGDDSIVCRGNSTTLHASGATTYSWSSGETVLGTGADFIVTPNVTSEYTVTGTDDKGCIATSTIVVEVEEPSEGGDITAPASVCIGPNSATLGLSNHVGDILRWESSKDAGTTWSPINQTTPSITVENLSSETHFRAVVKNGVCQETYSEVAVIAIDPKPVGGKLAFDIETQARVYLICEGAGPGYAVPLNLSGEVGEVFAWKYRAFNATSWQTVKAADGSNYTGLSLSADQIESLGITQTTVFTVEISSGVCTPNALSETALISVVATDIQPSPVEANPSVVCLGEPVTLTGGTGFAENPDLWSAGAFDNASITNHGWRIRRQNNTTDLGFDTDANNTEFDRWKRATPRSFTTASLTSPYPTSLVYYDSGVEGSTEGNKGFALVSGNYSSTMETPIFNLGSADEAVLTFDQAYNLTPGAEIKVEISTDGGATYTTLYVQAGPAVSGNNSNFGGGTKETRPNNKMELDLGAYMGMANLRIRFNYTGARSGDVWAVDNIKVPAGPQGAGMTWTDYTDPNNPVVIGTSDTETWVPSKIGLNTFEFQTKLVFDSQGDACDVAINAKTIDVFVYDTYTTTVTADLGSCGNFKVELNATVVNSAGETVMSYPTPDGYVGSWVITGDAELIDSNPEDDILAVNDPQAFLKVSEVGTYSAQWTLTPSFANETGEVYPVPATCALSPAPLEIVIEGCTTLDFDGVDDYVDLGSGYTGAVSVEAWIRPFERPTPTGGTTDPATGTVISSPSFHLDMAELSTYVTPGTRWYHVVVTSTGTLYIDGIPVGKSTSTSPATGNRTLIGAKWNNSSGEAENYFSGWIEEVRIWNGEIPQEQVRFLMNQRLQNLANIGVEIPLPAPGLGYGKLLGYFQLLTTTITSGNTPNLALSGLAGRLHNMETLQENTAPLPYTTFQDGVWTDEGSTGPWTHWDVWDIPNAQGSNSTAINWNIVKTDHNVQSGAKDITVLGLKSTTPDKLLTVADPSSSMNEYNAGQMLRVTHYLLLNGNIDLFGESQLVQDLASILDASSQGWLERDQQGTRSSFNYNYWSSPVSPGGLNADYSISSVMLDGTTQTPRPIDFGGTYFYADGALTSPIKISTYWLYKFHGLANDYFSWEWLGKDGLIDVGEGYTMKGTSGSAAIEDPQNYTFKGLPNNGSILMDPMSAAGDGVNYLIGNPYPSAINADQFIRDNLKDVAGGENETNVFNGSLYFWSHFAGSTHYLQEYIGGYAVYNLSGGIKAVANDDRINNTDQEGGKMPGMYIPIGQAFFVNTALDPVVSEISGITIHGGQIEFNNGQRGYHRETDEESVFHSQERDKLKGSVTGTTFQQEVPQRKIWLKFRSPMGYHRQILVTADENATDLFDLGYDAPLIEDNQEDLYWYFGEHEFVIQGIQDFNLDRELQLGMKISQEGALSITIDDLENIPGGMNIFLKDSLEQKIHNLRQGPYETTSKVGVFLDRFKIVFQDKTAVEEPEAPVVDEGDFRILYINGTREILIENPKLHKIQKILLSNLLGQQVHEYYDIPEGPEVRLPVRKFSSGVYVVKVKTQSGISTKKVILE